MHQTDETTPTSERIVLFEFGTEGGGAEVILLPDNRVVEKGSAGGILDEEDDPHRSWEVTYDSWQTWWDKFKEQHGSFWVYIYPIQIHDLAKPLIRQSLEELRDTTENWTESASHWQRYLG